MKPQHIKHSVSRLIVLKLCLLMVLMLFSSVHARPSETQGAPFAFRGGKRGQNAILALQQKLPSIASRYGRSPEKLRQTFLHDRDLWLDPVQNLLYICNFFLSKFTNLRNGIVVMFIHLLNGSMKLDSNNQYKVQKERMPCK